MRTNLPIILLCGSFAVAAGVPGWAIGQVAPAKQSPEPVTVELASGRTFTAGIDPETDEAQLWLRWSRPTASVHRPIRWDRVVRVRAADKVFSGDEFREAVRLFREQFPKAPKAITGAGQITMKGPKVPAAERGSAPVETDGGRFGQMRPVRSLMIDARLANWDSDVQTDGLLLELYPLDENGQLVPVRGTLQVHLVAELYGKGHRVRPFSRLGSWTERVRVSHFQRGPARYRRPFESVHPEFDLESSPYGMVHARISVPGQGVFQSTQSTVRIRPYSPIRDRLEQVTGSRFFPPERTTRGRR